MPSPRYDRALYLASALTAAGIPATVDPAAAASQAPCVLVPPPRMEFSTYRGAVVTWRLIALAAGSSAGAAAAWSAIDDLVARVAVELPVEIADPTAYVLPGGESVPAYALTFTEGID